MARPTRTFLPGCPHLVVQSTLDRKPALAGDEAKQKYLDCLRDVARLHDVKVHAYAIGDDEVLLLLTPEDGPSLSRMMQALGRRFVAWLNHRDQRRGTIWEGRFSACPLLTHHFALQAQRMIEAALASTTPAWSAGTSMVHAQGARWTSSSHHLGHKTDLALDSQAAYWALGNTPFDREARYRALLEEGLSRRETQQLLQAARSARPLADEDSLRQWEKRLGLSLLRRPRGRPRKDAASEGRSAS